MNHVSVMTIIIKIKGALITRVVQRSRGGVRWKKKCNRWKRPGNSISIMAKDRQKWRGHVAPLPGVVGMSE